MMVLVIIPDLPADTAGKMAGNLWDWLTDEGFGPRSILLKGAKDGKVTRWEPKLEAVKP